MGRGLSCVMFDFVSQAISSLGAFGIALLMFLENVFPPIPSEVIMPLAGFNAQQGEMSFWSVLIAGTVGSLAGALLWYWIGRRIGADRLKRLSLKAGRWLTITPDDIDRSNGWFERHGGAAVLLGRLLPTIRTFISVPAGVARMPLAYFTALTCVGTVVWNLILLGAGYLLGSNYDLVQTWLDPLSYVVIAAIVGAYLYRVVTYDADAAEAEMAPGVEGDKQG